MTVERVTRFYLGEFQTTLTKGGKYINELDPEEEKALMRCGTQHVRLYWCVVVGTARSVLSLLHRSTIYHACFFFLSPGLTIPGGQGNSLREGEGQDISSFGHTADVTIAFGCWVFASLLRMVVKRAWCGRTIILQIATQRTHDPPSSRHYLYPGMRCSFAPFPPIQARASADRAGPVLRPGCRSPAVPSVLYIRVQSLHHLGRHRQDAGQGVRPHQDRGALLEGAAGPQGRERLRVGLEGLAEEAR